MQDIAEQIKNLINNQSRALFITTDRFGFLIPSKNKKVAQYVNHISDNICIDILASQSLSEAKDNYSMYLEVAHGLIEEGNLFAANIIYTAINRNVIYNLFTPANPNSKIKGLLDHQSLAYLQELNQLFQSQENYQQKWQSIADRSESLPMVNKIATVYDRLKAKSSEKIYLGEGTLEDQQASSILTIIDKVIDAYYSNQYPAAIISYLESTPQNNHLFQDIDFGTLTAFDVLVSLQTKFMSYQLADISKQQQKEINEILQLVEMSGEDVTQVSQLVNLVKSANVTPQIMEQANRRIKRLNALGERTAVFNHLAQMLEKKISLIQLDENKLALDTAEELVDAFDDVPPDDNELYSMLNRMLPQRINIDSLSSEVTEYDYQKYERHYQSLEEIENETLRSIIISNINAFNLDYPLFDKVEQINQALNQLESKHNIARKIEQLFGAEIPIEYIHRIKQEALKKLIKNDVVTELLAKHDLKIHSLSSTTQQAIEKFNNNVQTVESTFTFLKAIIDDDIDEHQLKTQLLKALVPAKTQVGASCLKAQIGDYYSQVALDFQQQPVLIAGADDSTRELAQKSQYPFSEDAIFCLMTGVDDYQADREQTIKSFVRNHNQPSSPLYPYIERYLSENEIDVDNINIADNQFFRKLLIDYLDKGVEDKRIVHAEIAGKDIRFDNPSLAVTTLADFVGDEGVALFKLAMAEEANDPAFRNAVLAQSTQLLEGETWAKRTVMVLGGPSASGKTFSANLALAELDSQLAKKIPPQQGNIVVQVDGGIVREVSQMRKLLIQKATNHGFCGIKDLKKYCENDEQALKNIKGYIEQAAFACPDVSVVIPHTFSKSASRLTKKSDIKMMKQIQKLDDGSCQFVFAVVEGEQEEDFKQVVRHMGMRRAYQTAGFDEPALLNLNNKDICESKAYGNGPIADRAGYSSFDCGVLGSEVARKWYQQHVERPIIMHVVNDLTLIRPSLSSDGRQAQQQTYVRASQGEAGAFMISNKTLQAWQSSHQASYPVNINDPFYLLFQQTENDGMNLLINEPYSSHFKALPLTKQVALYCTLAKMIGHLPSIKGFANLQAKLKASPKSDIIIESDRLLALAIDDIEQTLSISLAEFNQDNSSELERQAELLLIDSMQMMLEKVRDYQAAPSFTHAKEVKSMIEGTLRNLNAYIDQLDKATKYQQQTIDSLCHLNKIMAIQLQAQRGRLNESDSKEGQFGEFSALVSALFKIKEDSNGLASAINCYHRLKGNLFDRVSINDLAILIIDYPDLFWQLPQKYQSDLYYHLLRKKISLGGDELAKLMICLDDIETKNKRYITSLLDVDETISEKTMIELASDLQNISVEKLFDSLTSEQINKYNQEKALLAIDKYLAIKNRASYKVEFFNQLKQAILVEGFTSDVLNDVVSNFDKSQLFSHHYLKYKQPEKSNTAETLFQLYELLPAAKKLSPEQKRQYAQTDKLPLPRVEGEQKTRKQRVKALLTNIIESPQNKLGIELTRSVLQTLNKRLNFYQRKNQLSHNYAELVYQQYLVKRAQSLATTSPDKIRYTPQGQFLADIELTELDYKCIYQEIFKDKQLENHNTYFEALSEVIGAPITRQTTCSLAVTLTPTLQENYCKYMLSGIEEQSQRDILGDALNLVLSEPHCSSIADIQQEFESHSRLFTTVIKTKLPELLALGGGSVISKNNFKKLDDYALKQINQHVKIAFQQALLAAYDPQSSTINYEILNKLLDKYRKQISINSKKIFIEGIKNIINDNAQYQQVKERIINTISSDDFEKQTATGHDYLKLTNDMNLVCRIVGTPFTAHDKQYGDEHIATRMIRRNAFKMQGGLCELMMLTDSNTEVRVPSLAVVDHWSKESEQQIIDDVLAKLQTAYKNVAKVKGGYRGSLTYHLLTSLKYIATDSNVLSGLNDPNKQNISAKCILKAAHQFNAKQVQRGQLMGLVYLQNIPVNRHGGPLSLTGSADLADISLMAEMAIINTLFTKSRYLPMTLRSAVTDCHTMLHRAYVSYLKDDSNPTKLQFSQSKQGKAALKALKKYKSRLKEIKVPKDSRASMHKLIAQTLCVLHARNAHLDLDNGEMMQALSIFLCRASIAGCKSANERYQHVSGRVELLKSMANRQGDYAEVEHLLIAELNNIAFNPKSDIKNLRKAFDSAYNQINLHGSATVISAEDQGGPAKLKAPHEQAMVERLYGNTNYGQAKEVNWLYQANASKLQAHKIDHIKQFSKADLEPLSIADIESVFDDDVIALDVKGQFDKLLTSIHLLALGDNEAQGLEQALWPDLFKAIKLAPQVSNQWQAIWLALQKVTEADEQQQLLDFYQKKTNTLAQGLVDRLTKELIESQQMLAASRSMGIDRYQLNVDDYLRLVTLEETISNQFDEQALPSAQQANMESACLVKRRKRLKAQLAKKEQQAKWQTISNDNLSKNKALAPLFTEPVLDQDVLQYQSIVNTLNSEAFHTKLKQLKEISTLIFQPSLAHQYKNELLEVRAQVSMALFNLEQRSQQLMSTIASEQARPKMAFLQHKLEEVSEKIKDYQSTLAQLSNYSLQVDQDYQKAKSSTIKLREVSTEVIPISELEKAGYVANQNSECQGLKDDAGVKLSNQSSIFDSTIIPTSHVAIHTVNHQNQPLFFIESSEHGTVQTLENKAAANVSREAKMKRAFIMAQQFLFNFSGRPSEDNKLYLKGHDLEQVEMMWGALILIGKALGFDKNAIAVTAAGFKPKSRSWYSREAQILYDYKENLGTEYIKNMLRLSKDVEAYKGQADIDFESLMQQSAANST